MGAIGFAAIRDISSRSLRHATEGQTRWRHRVGRASAMRWGLVGLGISCHEAGPACFANLVHLECLFKTRIIAGRKVSMASFPSCGIAPHLHQLAVAHFWGAIAGPPQRGDHSYGDGGQSRLAIRAENDRLVGGSGGILQGGPGDFLGMPEVLLSIREKRTWQGAHGVT